MSRRGWEAGETTTSSLLPEFLSSTSPGRCRELLRWEEIGNARERAKESGYVTPFHTGRTLSERASAGIPTAWPRAALPATPRAKVDRQSLLLCALQSKDPCSAICKICAEGVFTRSRDYDVPCRQLTGLAVTLTVWPNGGVSGAASSQCRRRRARCGGGGKSSRGEWNAQHRSLLRGLHAASASSRRYTGNQPNQERREMLFAAQKAQILPTGSEQNLQNPRWSRAASRPRILSTCYLFRRFC